MEIFLKERATGLWLMPSGRWEANREGAQEFGCHTEAVARAEMFHSLDVQIIVRELRLPTVIPPIR